MAKSRRLKSADGEYLGPLALVNWLTGQSDPVIPSPLRYPTRRPLAQNP